MKNVSREPENNKGIFFTKETFGMALILFSAITVILLLLSDVLFKQQIGYCQFLYGAMGYFSFVVFAAICYLGVNLVLNRKHKKGAWKNGTLVTLLIVLSFAIVQVASAPQTGNNFSEYVKACYSNGSGGIATCTGGGALFAVITYPALNFLSAVGCYIIFGLLIAGSILLLFRLAIKNAVRKATSKNRVADKNIVGVKEYSDMNFDFGNEPSMQPVQNRLYYGAGSNELGTASKKEKKSDRDRALSILYPDNNSKENKDNGKILNSGTMRSFASARTGDFAGQSYQRQVDNDLGRRDRDVYSRQNDNSSDDYGNVFDRRASVTERRNGGSYPSREGQRFTNHDVSFRSFDRSSDFSSRQSTRDNEYRRPIESDIPARQEQRVADFTRENERISRSERNSDEIYPPIDLGRINRGDSSAADRIKNLSFERSRESDAKLPQTSEDRQAEVFEMLAKDSSRSRIGDSVKEDITPATDIISERTRQPIEEKPVEEKPSRMSAADEITQSNVTKFNLNPEKKAIYIEPDTGEAVMPEEEKKSKKSSVEDSEQIPLMEQTEYIGIPEMPLRYKYKNPPIDLYKDNPKKNTGLDDSVETRCRIIEKTLESFNIMAHVENVIKGPTITRYEISIPEGTTVSKVPPRASDLAMRLEVDSVRIEAPIPGKNLIGIEVPNKVKEMVGMKELLLERDFQKSSPDALSIVLGEDVVGNPVITDLTKTPHLLVAGATGMGKSVFLNSLIMSLVTKYGPEDLRLVLVDPKQVEFTIFENLPHLLINNIITEASLCIGILDWAIDEMELRYKIFRSCYAQKIDEYNHSINPRTQRKMPKIVIIIDELGDLFSISSQVKHDIEDRIKRLTQKARAAGIHVVVATQRPDVTVITGVIKTNLPSRVAFKVLNYADSNTILNDGGADKLLGNGDMIFKTSNSALLKRIQGAYVSKEEMLRVLAYIRENNACYYDDNAQKYLDAKKASTQNGGTAASISFGGESESEGDPKTFNNIPIRNLVALKIVIEKKQASISALQRSMSIGYSTAGRIIDWMEKMNYISKFEGSKAREVLITMDEFDRLYGEADLD